MTLTGRVICEAVSLEQGGIVLVRFPFSNVIDYKIRPAMVISNNGFNKRFSPWFCPITSTRTEQGVSLKDSLAEGKLDRESFARTDAIATIEKDSILKTIGKVRREETEGIIQKVIQNMK